MNAAARELVLILFLMGFLLIICAAAVFVFIRQWRRERQSQEKTDSPERNTEDSES
ncbi:MAG TPA: hypothetical protein VGC91_07055 [Pyrinomonadaceae bacterium]|jgi:hypothetical protein